MLDPSDEIADIEFSEEDVDTLLTKLKDNKSPGVDNIHPTMLKNLHSELKIPLYLLFRKSLDEGTVPIMTGSKGVFKGGGGGVQGVQTPPPEIFRFFF